MESLKSTEEEQVTLRRLMYPISNRLSEICALMELAFDPENLDEGTVVAEQANILLEALHKAVNGLWDFKDDFEEKYEIIRKPEPEEEH